MEHAVLLEALGISPSLIAARGLRACPEAKHLELAEVGDDGKEHLLIPEAVVAWQGMKEAAHAAGIPIFILSAYRSVDRQVEIIRRKMSTGQKVEDILCMSAPPGFSEHHTGRAVDVGTVGVPKLTFEFGQTPAFAWLQQHAQDFGFTLSYPSGNAQGYQYEPWHWCYAAQPSGAADAPSARG